MTALCEGGIIKAWTEPQMVTLVANTRGKPALTICGIITEPMAEVSATEEPEMQPNKVDAMMFTRANPPRMKPTNTLAKLIKRLAIPPSAMMPPASTKNGIASSEKSSVPSEILSMIASNGRSIHKAPQIAAKPRE